MRIEPIQLQQWRCSGVSVNPKKKKKPKMIELDKKRPGSTTTYCSSYIQLSCIHIFFMYCKKYNERVLLLARANTNKNNSSPLFNNMYVSPLDQSRYAGFNKGKEHIVSKPSTCSIFFTFHTAFCLVRAMLHCAV